MGNGSNAGFVGLMTPMGLTALLLSFLALSGIIYYGSLKIKEGEVRARAQRAELKKVKAERERQKLGV